MKSRGFTLIEILVVIVILTISITVVTLSVGYRDKTQILEKEARRLFSVFEFATEYALLQSQELGFYVMPDQYQVLILGSKGWQPVENEKILTAHKLPDRLRLALSLEGSNISLKKNPKDKVYEPQILFLSSGEMTPFLLRMTLTIKNMYEFSIQGTETGELTLLKDGERY